MLFRSPAFGARHQVEARVRYWPMPEIARFDGGVAYPINRGYFRDAPNAPHAGDARYGYLDLTFTC